MTQEVQITLIATGFGSGEPAVEPEVRAAAPAPPLPPPVVEQQQQAASAPPVAPQRQSTIQVPEFLRKRRPKGY